MTGQDRGGNGAGIGAVTFVGAVCFLVGALLLLPERTETASGQIPAPGEPGH